MKRLLRTGDVQTYRRIVRPEDVASFHGKVIHPVCATFALARDIEWTSRLFVLQACDPDEEGIGTMLSIQHEAPAFVGEEVLFKATVEQMEGNELICAYTAVVGDRLIAWGKTGQKILKRSALELLFSKNPRHGV